MNDLTTLHDAWQVPEAPSPAARALARAALIERAARGGRGFRRPAITVRRASLAALAPAIAAAVGVLANLGGTGPAVPNASAQVLERAAHAVEKHPFTAPRDDQWIYTEDAIGGRDGGPPQTVRRWHRADGGGFAFLDEHGRLQVETITRPAKRMRGPLESYKALAALPTEPGALLRWAYEETEHITGAGTTRDAEAYSIFRGILGNGVVPPDLEAALFRAMKQIPGVTVSTVDVLGHPTLALALTDDWLRQELLLDERTYAYRGQRSTIVRDATIDPLKAGNATGEVKRGSTVVAARVSAGIVDRPGQRP